MQQEVKRFGPHHASPAVDLDSDNGQYNGHERGKRAWLDPCLNYWAYLPEEHAVALP